jgi:hypothetical protein
MKGARLVAAAALPMAAAVLLVLSRASAPGVESSSPPARSPAAEVVGETKSQAGGPQRVAVAMPAIRLRVVSDSGAVVPGSTVEADGRSFVADVHGCVEVPPLGDDGVLTVCAKGYATAHYPRLPRAHVLRLAELGSIEVRVDAGDLGDVEVVLMDDENDVIQDARRPVGSVAHFRDLEPARYGIALKGPHGVAAGRRCQVEAGKTTSVELAGGVTRDVFGRLQDAAGQPVAGARLEWRYRSRRPPGEMLEVWFRRSVMTASDGGYRLPAMPTGDYGVLSVVPAQGMAEHHVSLRSVAAERVDLTLPAPRPLRGRVRDGSGAGCPGARVRVYRATAEAIEASRRCSPATPSA